MRMQSSASTATIFRSSGLTQYILELLELASLAIEPEETEEAGKMDNFAIYVALSVSTIDTNIRICIYIRAMTCIYDFSRDE